MSEEGGVTLSEGGRNSLTTEVTPALCKGTLGTWRFQVAPGHRAGNSVTSKLGRDHEQTEIERGVCGPALQLHRSREGSWRKAKVRTGFGKSDRPGSQGGLGKRGPWWMDMILPAYRKGLVMEPIHLQVRAPQFYPDPYPLAPYPLVRAPDHRIR